jgi:hypothetical protein
MSIESADNILHVKNSTMRISRVEVGQTLSVGNIEFDTTTTLASVTSNGNNTTPHTISSSNVTTGLVTTSNVVVGGELIVGGTSLVNAIYPVGTVIDRATAITDTHPNGKYKAFLAAPDQEWELVSDGQDVVPLEYLTQLGETTSFCGRATLTPATSVQSLTTAFLPITGTEITGFTPVLGSTKILYNSVIHLSRDNANGITNFRVQVKEGIDWITIPKSSVSYADEGVSHPNDKIEVFYVIYLGDTINDLSQGRTTTVRPTLGIRVIGREHIGYEMQVHQSYYHFIADDNSASTGQFVPPRTDVISLGPEANLKYKRTV